MLVSTKQQFRMHASRQSGTRTGGGRQLVLHFFVLAYRHPALTTKPTLAPLLKTFNGIDQTHRTCFKKEWCPKGFSEHPFQGSSTGASHGYSTTSTADHSSVKPADKSGCSRENRSRFGRRAPRVRERDEPNKRHEVVCRSHALRVPDFITRARRQTWRFPRR